MDENRGWMGAEGGWEQRVDGNRGWMGAEGGWVSRNSGWMGTEGRSTQGGWEQ